MTNKEIIAWLESRKKQRLAEHSRQEPEELWRRGELEIIGAILPMLKEQPQGVDVWVSMSDFNSYAQISMKEPEKFDNGSSNVTYLTNSACAAISGEFAKAFNISPGQCAKFKIVRCE